MVKQIDRILVRSVVPVGAAFFFVLGVINVVGALVVRSVAPGPITHLTLNGPIRLSFAGFPGPLVLASWPFVSAIIGAAACALIAWFYNLLAPRIGAVRISLRD